MNSELVKPQQQQQQNPTPLLNDKILGLVLSIIALSFIGLVFIQTETFKAFISLLIFGFIIWTLPSMRGTLMIITYSLLTIAMTMFITTGANVIQWMDGIRLNIAIVSIFIFVPLLGIPIRLGGYLTALKIVFEKFNQKTSYLYLGSKLLTHILAIVLNIGSVSIVHYLSEAASPIQSKRLFVNAINRGFVCTIFWSPYFSAMALILSALSVKWSSIVLYSLGFVVISLVISFLVDWNYIKSIGNEKKEGVIEQTTIGANEKEIAKKKIKELLVLLIIIMVSVIVLEMVLPISMPIIICLVAFFFPIIWCLLNRQLSKLVDEWKAHVFETLPRMKKEVVLFFIAGFFSAAFIQTNLNTDIIEIANLWFGSFKIGITYVIVFLMMILAVLGLHPIVPVTILVTSFDPILLGFSKEYFAILLLISWGISNLISPSTAVNNLLANLSDSDITEVSLKWNIKFSVIIALLVPIYLSFVNI